MSHKPPPDEIVWECLVCGMINREDSTFCSRCYTSKADATKRRSGKLTMCPDCSHKHVENVYCHVLIELTSIEEFMEADDSNDDEEDSSVDEDELLSDRPSDSDLEEKSISGFGLIIAAANQQTKQEKKKKIPTPDWARRSGYGRCNCRVGVPSKSKRFDPVPQPLIVGGIYILQYDDLMSDAYLNANKNKIKFNNEEEEEKEKLYEIEKQKGIVKQLPYILSFLALRHIAPAASTNKGWNSGVCQYNAYIDMRNVVPWQVLRSHRGQVDSVLIHGNTVFSSGDKRIIATDIYNDTVSHMITRDSAFISELRLFDANLLCCSANGSIRIYPHNFEPKHMRLERTMWEHAGCVRRLMVCDPLPGVCERHGKENHSCLLYSACEDRSVIVWDSHSCSVVRKIDNPNLRRFTYQSLTQSYAHLMAGTSNGTILIFSKINHCDRDDIHSCSAPEADKSYCLQVTLKLPVSHSVSGNSTVVHSLQCTGPNYAKSMLCAGDSNGQLTLWKVPEYGLDYKPLVTSRAHQGALRCIESTWKHLITAGDDGIIIFHDLDTLERVRRLDITTAIYDKGFISNPHIKRRIKSMYVSEDFVNGGSMCVGTSYGEILVMSIGMYV